MKRLVVPSLFAICLLCPPAFAAPQQQVESSVAVPAAPAVPATPATPAASSDAKYMAERYCVRSTGSRIVSRQKKTESAEDFDKRCLSYNGRVYTRDDIERTGEVDLADALRKLDPAIR